MTGRLEACIRLAKKIGIKNKTILDVGCSNGWFCRVALDAGAKQVYAIEPDSNKLKEAKKSAPKANIQKGVAGKLEYSKNKFDLVTLLDVIEHIPVDSEIEVLNEINRVLKPKGHLLISTPYQNLISQICDPAWYFGHRHYSKEKLEDFLIQTGFKVNFIATYGSFWEIIAMWFLYFTKWVLRIPMPFEEWFDSKRRKEYQNNGVVTIMVIAQKI